MREELLMLTSGDVSQRSSKSRTEEWLCHSSAGEKGNGMKKIRKIFRDKRGEGYIDVAVMVLCVMLIIALGVRLFPIFITKIQVDNFADELVREAEISGRVGYETSNRQRVLEEKTGIHPTVQWSSTGKLQLNQEVTVTVTVQKDLGLFGNFGSFPITIRARASGKSEVYWK